MRLPWLTAIVLLLNAAVFLVMLVAPGAMSDPETLARWGASVGPLTTNGGWWRLLAATFVHAGLVSFAIDMAALAPAAALVERLFGRVALAGVYVASSVLAGGIALYADPLTVASGSAAPVFGVYGLLTAAIVRGTLRRSPVTIPLRVVRRLSPVAAVFVLSYAWSGGTAWTSGLATFVIGFAIGVALSRDAGDRIPAARRALPLTAIAVAMSIVVIVPLKGMIDVRSQIARLFTVEERTAGSYQAAAQQFTLGRIKADALTERIERDVLPELQRARAGLGALAGVPRQQQFLVSGANEYLRLRCESWSTRADALRRSNMRLLRVADEQERIAIAALEKLRPAVAVPPGSS